MTTLKEVIDRTRVRLMGQQREPFNTLSASLGGLTTNTTLNLTLPIRFIEGGRLSIGLETMLVTAVDTTGNTCTVIRAVDGSAIEAHASGSLVFINPTWTNHEMFEGINEELADLSSPTNGLFRIKTATDIIWQPSIHGYNLAGITAGEFIDVWRVRFDEPGPLNIWRVIPRRWWRIDRAADTSEFASGIQLVINRGGYPGHKIRVSYKASFTALANTNEAQDILAVTGLHNEAHNILSLGAAYRLMGGSEAQRSYSTSQADPRRGDETPTTAHARSMQSFLQMREERIIAEQARLARQFPEALT